MVMRDAMGMPFPVDIRSREAMFDAAPELLERGEWVCLNVATSCPWPVHPQALEFAGQRMWIIPLTQEDHAGVAVRFVLTPGQAHDVPGFRPLMRIVADRIDALLADKGYDADAIRKELADAKVEAVIPAKANRRQPAPHDRQKYRWRNHIERLFNKLKNWRRIATRYDKTADSYIGFVTLASALLRLPFVLVA